MEKKTIFRAGRVVNTSILLFGFFSPWLTDCSGEPRGNGVDALLLLKELPSVARYDPGVVMSVMTVALVALAMVLFVILSLCKAAFDYPKNSKWLFITIGLGLSGTCGVFLPIQVPMVIFLEWGFWLTCIGFICGLLLEISEWQITKTQTSIGQHPP